MHLFKNKNKKIPKPPKIKMKTGKPDAILLEKKTPKRDRLYTRAPSASEQQQQTWLSLRPRRSPGRGSFQPPPQLMARRTLGSSSCTARGGRDSSRSKWKMILLRSFVRCLVSACHGLGNLVISRIFEEFRSVGLFICVTEGCRRFWWISR